MNYDKIPKDLGIFKVDVKEYFSYTYLPIKLSNQWHFKVEKRLNIFDKLLGRAACDFIGEYGIDKIDRSYVYLTAKHAYQKKGCGFNRQGYHSDGFLTNDINYIWSNKQPTIFNKGPFILSKDDQLSMKEMEEQALPANDYTFESNSLLRLDQYSIHKVAPYEEGPRAFIKISFSEDVYNLAGNSVNYELDYNWEYRERGQTRNVPQCVK